MVYVLDCSLCAALFMPDERSDKADALFETVVDKKSEIVVPQIWWYEIASVLALAVKRGRLTSADSVQINKLLSAYDFVTDTNYGSAYTKKLLAISRDYGLTVYDSAYLELARRKQAAVGTLDADLKAACALAGLTVL